MTLTLNWNLSRFLQSKHSVSQESNMSFQGNFNSCVNCNTTHLFRAHTISTYRPAFWVHWVILTSSSLLCPTRNKGSTYFCLTWLKEILSPTCLDFSVSDSAGWLHGEPGKMSPEHWLKELAISFSLFYGRLLLPLLPMITTKHITHTCWQLKLRHANQLLLKITLHLFPVCIMQNSSMAEFMVLDTNKSMRYSPSYWFSLRRTH